MVTYNTLENIQLPFNTSLTNKRIDYLTLERGTGGNDFEKYPASIILPKKIGFLHPNHARSVSRKQNMLNGPEIPSIHTSREKNFLVHERVKEIEPVTNHPHIPWTKAMWHWMRPNWNVDIHLFSCGCDGHEGNKFTNCNPPKINCTGSFRYNQVSLNIKQLYCNQIFVIWIYILKQLRFIDVMEGVYLRL